MVGVSLEEFGVETTAEFRTPNPRIEEFGLDTVECPCGSPLSDGDISTIPVNPEEFVIDSLRDLDESLVVRGWDCENQACNRRIAVTLELAEHRGTLTTLTKGWYPVRVATDDPELASAVVFTPKKEVLRRLDPDDHPEHPGALTDGGITDGE